MGRSRVGLLVAASLVTVLAGSGLAGCGTQPSSNPPPPAGAVEQPPAPTAAVGADGQPISNLCDLLSDADFSELAGAPAQKPAAADPAATTATCDYGGGMKLTVQVGGSVDDATSAYKASLANGGFTSVKQGAIGGVDESDYGTAGSAGVLNLRRLKLVVSIAVPGTDGEVTLIQLAARVLSRAHALGT